MRQNLTLIGNLFAPGRNSDGTTVTVEVTNGGFPYVPPEGKTFYLTHWHLTNKYPFQPPAYDEHMATMYFKTYLGTVTAHFPCDHFDPPIPYMAIPSGDEVVTLRGWVENGMTEGQWVYVTVQGYLEDEEV